jgi:hypothetical protein
MDMYGFLFELCILRCLDICIVYFTFIWIMYFKMFGYLYCLKYFTCDFTILVKIFYLRFYDF